MVRAGANAALWNAWLTPFSGSNNKHDAQQQQQQQIVNLFRAMCSCVLLLESIVVKFMGF